jgi:peroxidase
MRPEWTQMIRDMYRGENHDVDLYIGLLMEQHVSGGSLGPTGICILGKQFKTLKTQGKNDQKIE